MHLYLFRSDNCFSIDDIGRPSNHEISGRAPYYWFQELATPQKSVSQGAEPFLEKAEHEGLQPPELERPMENISIRITTENSNIEETDTRQLAA
ncbi:hypothetical protein HED49_19990 [Ochrobactrum daejeonense]|nr:hypothetical protein [Brucella daejeonensis]